MLRGGLFTRDWLTEGITETDAWQALDNEAVQVTHARIEVSLRDLLGRRTPNEAETEAKLVWPTIRALGWEHVSVQQSMAVRGRTDVPDGLLFPDSAADEVSRDLEPWQRFRHGSALLEAKRWGRPLDRQGQGDQGVPATQLMHYLRRADDITGGAMRWGILTNGRHWRLYWQGALSIAEDFLEVDLGKIFGLPGCEPDLLDVHTDRDHAFRLFLLLFGRDAFLPGELGRSFHEQALLDARQWEASVARNLSDVVFREVFPLLVSAISEQDPERPVTLDGSYLESVRSAAMVLLYRLLFVLYAEDRNLLPDERGPYAEFSLTRLRFEIAERKEAGGTFASRSLTYWSRLETIFGAIAEGDDTLGIPPYNGGLFDDGRETLLSRVRLPDSVIGEILFRLSHRPDIPRPKYISYRDLTVQQLGSIYESILEFGVEATDEGVVRPRADNSARHRSGSYYTPEELVSLIIARAVGPLVEERTRAFAQAVEAGVIDAELASLDPATRLLELKILDPAMGSGHFLVSLVDWLSDKVLTAIGDAEAVAGGGYASPLLGRIATLRAEILGHARAHCWPIVEEQLEDRHIVRRMVLKRCVYGVDLNPMAVELAKVALWLHSFTVGAPLSFLDHHLRCGNSVLGAWVRPSVLWLANRGSLMVNSHLQQIDNIARQMEQIEEIADTDISEVDRSRAIFGTVEEASAPLDAFFSMVETESLTRVFADAPRRVRETPEVLEREGASERVIAKARAAQRAFDRAGAMQSVLEGSFGDPVAIAQGHIAIAPAELRAELGLDLPTPVQTSLLAAVPDDRRRLLANSLVAEARSLASEHRFFNWEIAFPGVWSNLTSEGRTGGFDAVIGNPPYVRQEVISAIKPALQKAFGSYAGTADLYVYFYEQGLKLLRPGGRLAYVVTNKWLKAGYAAGLRRLFAEDAWVEFLADFGHAKQLFPSADVFPSVIVVRKPDGSAPPVEFDLAAIPREAVPRAGLAEAVRTASYRSARSTLTEEAWILEPPPVAALLAKIRANGVPLSEYAGVKPYRGVLTGFNEAFLVDTQTRERLVQEDARAAEIIKPYLRGQDIERWVPEWAGLWMIFTRRGICIEDYPSVLRHLEQYHSSLEPKPGRWAPAHDNDIWPGRKGGNYQWYEIQDSVDYWAQMLQPKIIYTEITWTASFAFDAHGRFVNNTAYFLPSTDLKIAAVLNSPVSWWFSWRAAQHGKDEALRMLGAFIEPFPLAVIGGDNEQLAEELSNLLVEKNAELRAADHSIADWLQHSFGLTKLPSALQEVSRLDGDAFVDSVRGAMPSRDGLTPRQLRQLREAFADAAEPARLTRGQVLGHEQTLAAIVERAYGLTPEEVRMMWETAPPRMPLPSPQSGGAD